MVGAVKEWEKFLSFHKISNLLPLLFGGVYTSRVVGTGVQDDDSTLRSGLQVLQESGKVEATGNRVPVSVLTDILKVGVPEQKSFNYSID